MIRTVIAISSSFDLSGGMWLQIQLAGLSGLKENKLNVFFVIDFWTRFE